MVTRYSASVAAFGVADARPSTKKAELRRLSLLICAPGQMNLETRAGRFVFDEGSYEPAELFWVLLPMLGRGCDPE